ncbi:MAG: hypothetical protein VZR27_00875 [Acutalibacteraceae bacterium]|nr:hypothetical protein [Acutalibacteraceae bacterium]
MRIKNILIVMLVLFLTSLFSASANAEENYTDTDEILTRLYYDSGADELIDIIPDEARDFLSMLDIDDFRMDSDSGFTPDSLIKALTYMISSNYIEPLRIFISIICIIFINAIFTSLRSGSLGGAFELTLSTVTILCTVAIVSPPVLLLISSLTDSIKTASDFMLMYIPVISVLIASSGKPLSASMYYGVMIYVCSGILKIVSMVVIPLLKSVTALSAVGSVSDKVKFTGVVEFFKKSLRIALTFCMSIFTAFLTMRTIITTSEDSLSNRAVKFAISNFVPLVGGALSDAYQTVLSCVKVLKSGVGVTAMIAVFAIFLPAVVKCLLWQIVLSAGVSVCGIFSDNKTASLLSSLSDVVSSICAIELCAMVMYIISTTVIILVGG